MRQSLELSPTLEVALNVVCLILEMLGSCSCNVASAATKNCAMTVQQLHEHRAHGRVQCELAPRDLGLDHGRSHRSHPARWQPIIARERGGCMMATCLHRAEYVAVDQVDSGP